MALCQQLALNALMKDYCSAVIHGDRQSRRQRPRQGPTGLGGIPASPPRAAGPPVTLRVAQGGDQPADGDPLPPRHGRLWGHPPSIPVTVTVPRASQLPPRAAPSLPPSAGEPTSIPKSHSSPSPRHSRASPDTSFDAPHACILPRISVPPSAPHRASTPFAFSTSLEFPQPLLSCGAPAMGILPHF